MDYEPDDLDFDDRYDDEVFFRTCGKCGSRTAPRWSESLRIPSGQVIVSEEDLRRVRDRLYRLESAIEDVESDLGESTRSQSYREAFEHLYEAAKDLAGVMIDPVRQ